MMEFRSYSKVGGYPLYYDVFYRQHGSRFGQQLCPRCAKQFSFKLNADPDDITDLCIEQKANWENPNMYCDECSERIESAYAEDDEEPKIFVSRNFKETLDFAIELGMKDLTKEFDHNGDRVHTDQQVFEFAHRAIIDAGYNFLDVRKDWTVSEQFWSLRDNRTFLFDSDSHPFQIISYKGQPILNWKDQDLHYHDLKLENDRLSRCSEKCQGEIFIIGIASWSSNADPIRALCECHACDQIECVSLTSVKS